MKSSMVSAPEGLVDLLPSKHHRLASLGVPVGPRLAAGSGQLGAAFFEGAGKEIYRAWTLEDHSQGTHSQGRRFELLLCTSSLSGSNSSSSSISFPLDFVPIGSHHLREDALSEER